MFDGIGVWIAGIVISLIIALILREVVCWYYKINRIVDLLESIDHKLSPQMVDTQQPDTPVAGAAPAGWATRRAREIISENEVDDWDELDRIIESLSQVTPYSTIASLVIRLEELKQDKK